jgi:inositol polyphosphate-4-phosphatase
MALTNALNGTSVIGCKSGKDRTSMAVTLEEGRIVKENCGISSHQVSTTVSIKNFVNFQVIEVVDTLRRNGCRRENCRKNVGKALYSFSPFQLHFLPKEFRPPAGAFAHNVAS